jgi:hypothetical protein
LNVTLLDHMTDEEKLELQQLISQLAPWTPHPSNKPQCMAYESEANEILYGGSAGGAKTDTLLGLARMKHTRSLVLRRNFPELERSVISRALEFMGGSYNSAKHVIVTDGRRIEFGHMEKPGNPQQQGDEQQYSSAPYDLIVPRISVFIYVLAPSLCKTWTEDTDNFIRELGGGKSAVDHQKMEGLDWRNPNG